MSDGDNLSASTGHEDQEPAVAPDFHERSPIRRSSNAGNALAGLMSLVRKVVDRAIQDKANQEGGDKFG